MNCKSILERTTLQHLSFQIRDESTLLHHAPESFDNREEASISKYESEIKKYLTDEQIMKIEKIINEYVGELCEIYFNMGIKTGAKLMTQLLNESNRDY